MTTDNPTAGSAGGAPAGAPGPLERRVQRLTAAVAVLAVGLALSVLWHFLPNPEVSASRFTLRDSTGAWRGALEVRPDGSPTLRLNDARGRAIVYGIVYPDGTPSLRLNDSTGTSRVVLEVSRDGSPHARLLDPAGRTGVHAWLGADARPWLDVRWGSVTRHVSLPDSGESGARQRPREAASRGR